MIKCALHDGGKSEVLKNERKEGILTFKRDSSSGWPSLEVEGAAGLVSSPRSLTSLCKILISSFAHKIDVAHNFSVDFF